MLDGFGGARSVREDVVDIHEKIGFVLVARLQTDKAGRDAGLVFHEVGQDVVDVLVVRLQVDRHHLFDDMSQFGIGARRWALNGTMALKPRTSIF